MISEAQRKLGVAVPRCLPLFHLCQNLDRFHLAVGPLVTPLTDLRAENLKLKSTNVLRFDTPQRKIETNIFFHY